MKVCVLIDHSESMMVISVIIASRAWVSTVSTPGRAARGILRHAPGLIRLIRLHLLQRGRRFADLGLLLGRRGRGRAMVCRARRLDGSVCHRIRGVRQTPLKLLIQGLLAISATRLHHVLHRGRLLLVGMHMVSVDLEQAASPIIVLLVRLAHLL